MTYVRQYQMSTICMNTKLSRGPEGETKAEEIFKE